MKGYIVFLLTACTLCFHGHTFAASIYANIYTKTEGNIQFLGDTKFRKIEHQKMISRYPTTMPVIPKTDPLIEMLSERILGKKYAGSRALSLATLGFRKEYTNLPVQILGLQSAVGYDIREEMVYDMEDQDFDILPDYIDTHEMYYTASNTLRYTFSPTRKEISFQFFPIAPQDIELSPDNRIYKNTPSLVLIDPVLQTTAPSIEISAYNTDTQEYDTFVETTDVQKYSYNLHQLLYSNQEQKASIPALLPYYQYHFSLPIDAKYTQYQLTIHYADRVIEDSSGYRIDFGGQERDE